MLSNSAFVISWSSASSLCSRGVGEQDLVEDRDAVDLHDGLSDLDSRCLKKRFECRVRSLLGFESRILSLDGILFPPVIIRCTCTFLALQLDVFDLSMDFREGL